MRKKTVVLVAVMTAGLGAVAPSGVDGKGKAVKQMRTGYGLTGAGSLIKFNAANTSRTRTIGRITGLASGEKLVGIDFRPVLGEIYGLSDRSNVYEVDMRSARATMKSSLKTAGGAPVTLEGTSFGVDFNPTSDRLRVVSGAGQNLRIDVDTGVTTLDQTLSYRAGDRNTGSRPQVTAAAYSNNDNDSFLDSAQLYPAGRMATSTKLYTIGFARSSLSLQDPPNDGSLRTIGRLLRRTNSPVGFDIFSPVNSDGNVVTNVGYVSLRQGRRTRLYKVSLRTGRATLVRGDGSPFGAVQDIAIVP